MNNAVAFSNSQYCALLLSSPKTFPSPHSYLAPKHFITPNKTRTHWTVTPHSPLPQPLATSSWPSVSVGLPVLEISCAWTHPPCDLWAWLLSLRIMFSRTAMYGSCQYLPPFYACVISRCMDVPCLFIYSPVDGHLACSHSAWVLRARAPENQDPSSPKINPL